MSQSQQDDQEKGRLVVVGTPIGNLGDLAPRTVRSLAEADLIACEDTRVTRKLLSAAGVRSPRLVALHEHNEARRIPEILRRIEKGATVALTSDAGMPAISDPGERLVAAVAAAGMAVVVVPGPSAVTSALVVSGLPSGRFSFEGFLPRRGPERAARIAETAARGSTTVLFEAPTRLGSTLAALTAACGAERRCAVAWELTKLHEGVWRGSLAEATARFAGRELKGEYAVVLEGAPAPAAATDADIESALREQHSAGHDRRTAIAEVSARLGVSRRRVYQVSHGRRV